MEPTTDAIEISYPIEGAEDGTISLLPNYETNEIYLTLEQDGFLIEIGEQDEETARLIEENTGIPQAEQSVLGAYPTVVLTPDVAQSLYDSLGLLLAALGVTEPQAPDEEVPF